MAPKKGQPARRRPEGKLAHEGLRMNASSQSEQTRGDQALKPEIFLS